MLKKEFRLPAYSRLSHPKTIRSSTFLLKLAPNDLSLSRFGFIIGKKKDKSAVARNRIRRKFRACIEELSLAIKPGYDMLFFLERGIIEKNHEELLVEIRELLQSRRLIS
jgi:ribonuclease P protein component